MSQLPLTPELLVQLPLFQGLTPESLEDISRSLHSHSYPPGASVLTAAQPGEAVYVVVEGWLRIFLEQRDGSEVTFAFLGPGDTVGEMSLVDQGLRSANATTLTSALLLWMDRLFFQRCLKTQPLLTYNLARQLTSRLRHANEQVQALSRLGVTGRVAHQLLSLAARHGHAGQNGQLHLPLPLTQQDIADLVGSTRESVNRAMVTLRNERALDVDAQHHITLLDLESLRRYSSPE